MITEPLPRFSGVVYTIFGLPMHPVDPPSPDYVPALGAVSSPYLRANVLSDPEEKEASEEEDKEHLTLADPVLAPVVDHVPSSEETEPFETDESATTPPSPPAGRTTTWMFVRPQSPMPSLSEVEVKRLLALPTPPPSPLISLSPPSVEERFARCLAAPALPLPPLPPLPSSLYLPQLVPTSLPAPSPPLPPLPTSLFIPPLVDRREDIPKVELPPRKRLRLTTPTLRYEVRESSTAAARPTGGHRADYGFIGTLDAETRRQRAKEVGYGIRDVWVDPSEAIEEIAPTTLEGVNAKVTELVEVHEEDTQDIYAMIEDAQDRQTHLSKRVDVLIEERTFHQENVLLME
ncbi:hypothetical protein Tco_0755346 [Tanacetum coccineum]